MSLADLPVPAAKSRVRVKAQTRPWQAPMPARVQSLAPWISSIPFLTSARMSPAVTSSQRQICVSSVSNCDSPLGGDCVEENLGALGLLDLGIASLDRIGALAGADDAPY